MKQLSIFSCYKWLTLFLLIAFCIPVKAQQVQLPDGVYLSFSDFTTRVPSFRFSQIRATSESKEILTEIDLENTIIYFSSGKNFNDSVALKDIFGVTRNGRFHVLFHHQNKSYLARSIRSGVLWQFATQILEQSQIYEPSAFGRPGYYRNVSSQILVQLVLDTRSGKLHTLDPETLLMLIATDEEVTKEYASLSRKNKRKNLFIYLNKFNTKYR
jgi:hypothetical protein